MRVSEPCKGAPGRCLATGQGSRGWASSPGPQISPTSHDNWAGHWPRVWMCEREFPSHCGSFLVRLILNRVVHPQPPVPPSRAPFFIHPSILHPSFPASILPSLIHLSLPPSFHSSPSFPPFSHPSLFFQSLHPCVHVSILGGGLLRIPCGSLGRPGENERALSSGAFLSWCSEWSCDAERKVGGTCGPVTPLAPPLTSLLCSL